MLRPARIALACALLVAPAAFAAPAAAQPPAEPDEPPAEPPAEPDEPPAEPDEPPAEPPAEPDAPPDAELGDLGEELDEEFREWGELEEEAVEARPDPEEEEPAEDPRADMRPATYDAQNWPLANVERPLALGPGMFELRATAAVDLTAGSTLDVLSLAPDLYYGVNERFEIAVLHTRFALLGDEPVEGRALPLGARASTSPALRAGDGLCLGEGCARLYDNVGIEARLALGAMRGPTQLRVSAGMEAANFDPRRVGARASVTARFRAGSLALLVEPSIRVGLVRRGAGNEDVLSVPVTAQFQATRRIVVELSSGAYGPTGALRDDARVPLAVGGLAALSPALDVGVSAGFPSVIGGGADPGGVERTAAIVVAYRL